MTVRKLTILTALAICSLLRSYAQQQHCGKLVTYFGIPLKGITVKIAGTSKTTVTDKNGNFCIDVLSGEVIEYIRDGKTLRKEIAYFADDSTSSRYANFLKTQFSTDKRFKASIGVLDKNSPTWSGTSEIEDWNSELHNAFGQEIIVRNISAIYYNLNGTQAVVLPTSKTMTPDTKLSFQTGFSIARVNKLPGYQQSFAQGRSQNNVLTYRGPETNEPFSWGPALSDLEYNGIATPYSSHGSVVPKGQGNGAQANAYNPYNFFKTAMATNNVLDVYASLFKGILQFNYTNQYGNGIMPTASSSTNNFTLKWKRGTELKWNTTAFYHNTVNNLPERGANMTTLMYDISTTPPTFDNANGFTTKEAARNPLSYYVNNTERQYSNLADNPYRFINNRVDKLNRFETGGKLEAIRQANNLSLLMHADYTYNNTDEKNGMIPYTPVVMPGWQSLEKNHSLLSSIEARLTLPNSYYYRSFAWQVVPRELSFKYLNDYTASQFNMRGKDYSQTGTADNGRGYNRIYNRDANNVAVSVNNFHYNSNNKLQYCVTANAYNSSTLTGKKIYFLPSFLVGGNFYNRYGSALRNLRFSAAYNQSISEAPLNYPNRYFGSITMPAQNFRRYNEFDNYSFASTLRPERSGTWDFSVTADFNFRAMFLNITSGFYYGSVKDFVAVQNTLDKFVMLNSGNYRKQGFELKIETGKYAYNAGRLKNFRTWISFSNPTLKATEVNEGMIRIAGFDDVAVVAKQGEAFGAIYGTRWMRNAAGQRIIGNDGYPLPDTVQGIIGNPTPKYMLRLGNILTIKKFEMQFTLEYKRGGEMWNGSLATMNYHGTSAVSATQRSVNKYIFDGVLQNGSKNNIPVTFYDPSEDVSKNYSVRYGSTGVAEDAIQDASWLRLQHVAVNYSLFSNKQYNKTRTTVNIGWWLDNVLLWTPYSGVDPQTSLFGYSAARGLDYFNMPATWSTGLSIQITLR